MRRLLAGEDGSFAPAPGVETSTSSPGPSAPRASRSGCPSDPASLPPGVGLPAYRIVQEALTNPLRHARAATSRVDVRRAYQPAAVEVAVVDDGGARRPPPPGGGRGLLGMRERVAARTAAR